MTLKLNFLILFCLLSFAAFAGPDNIAGKAKVTASSVLNQNYDAANVTDGIIGVPGKGEWACEGQTAYWGYVRFPWIQLTWDKPQMVDKVVLYDRPSEKEHIAGGKLLFSDSSVVWVNQIPNDGTGKAISFKAKKTKWIKFIATDGTGKNLGLSEIEVFPSPEQYKDYVSTVDPYIETDRGRYFFFITGARPFGMVGTAPMTRNKNQSGGGYNYNETDILGFPQIHTWMISGIDIMPASYDINPTLGEQGWKSKFSHDDEIVQPGYQRVYLRKYHTWVELTATDRVTFHKFRFTRDMKAKILTSLGGYVGNSRMVNASVEEVNKKEFEGSFTC